MPYSSRRAEDASEHFLTPDPARPIFYWAQNPAPGQLPDNHNLPSCPSFLSTTTTELYGPQPTVHNPRPATHATPRHASSLPLFGGWPLFSQPHACLADLSASAQGPLLFFGRGHSPRRAFVIGLAVRGPQTALHPGAPLPLWTMDCPHVPRWARLLNLLPGTKERHRRILVI